MFIKRALIVLLTILSTVVCTSGQRRGGRGAAPGTEQYPPIARDQSEEKLLAAIDQAVKTGALYQNVPASDGRMLRLLAETANAKHVVEIGTSTGLSGLWFCLARSAP